MSCLCLQYQKEQMDNQCNPDLSLDGVLALPVEAFDAEVLFYHFEEKTAQTLRWLFLNERRFEIDLYNEYKSYFSGKDWPRELEKLISEKENSEFAEEIFVEEKMYDRLFLSVKKNTSVGKVFINWKSTERFCQRTTQENLCKC